MSNPTRLRITMPPSCWSHGVGRSHLSSYELIYLGIRVRWLTLGWRAKLLKCVAQPLCR